MYTWRLILFVLVCSLGLAGAPVFAQSSDAAGGEGTSMMGSGSGGMMGSGAGSTMVSNSAAGSQRAGGDYLDAIGDQIAKRYQLMQHIAESKDKSERRQLVHQYLQTTHGYGGHVGAGARRSRGGGPGMMGFGPMGYGAMGPGMMGYGPMGYGAMGPGMMGYGARGYGAMGPGMMGYGPRGCGAMGPGMMGYGPGQGMTGPGMMGPGMMGNGTMGNGTMGYGRAGRAMMSPGGLTDEQLDRMAEHMAESYKDMQQIAQTTDKAERRKLMREHFKDMRNFWQDQDQNEDQNEDQ